MKKEKCWHCQYSLTIESDFCNNCGVILPLTNRNYFHLLQIKQQYIIDLKQLDDKYFALQKIYHPDRFINKDNKEKIIALEHSMAINEAYNKLKNPITRAAYLLKLNNLDVESEDSNIKPDLEFLEEALTEREELLAINNKEQLEQFEEKLLQRQMQATEQYNIYYLKENFTEAARIYIKLKYNSKLLEEINSKKRFIE